MLAGRLTRCQILLPFVTHFKKSGQARFEARKGNTGQISRQPTPNLTQDLCAAVNQRQKVSLEQYAKTGGLRPPCKFLGRSLPRKENGYFLAIFEQKPTQDAWHILTTLEILSWYTYRSQQNYSISANEMLHQQICYLMVFWKMKKLQPFFWPYDCFLFFLLVDFFDDFFVCF